MRHAALRLVSAVLLTACAVDQDEVAPTSPVSLVPTPAPPSEYRMNILGAPDTVNSRVTAINAYGNMVGVIGTSQSGQRPDMGVIWDASGLPTNMTDGLGMEPADINDYGDAVANRGGRSWVYFTADKRVQLPLPFIARTTTAAALNWQGTIVGVMTDRSGRTTPLVWTRVSSKQWTAAALPMQRGWDEAGATDINALGDIVGWVRTSQGVSYAWVWFANGQLQNVAKLAPGGALRINNKQEVLLRTWDDAGNVVPTVVHAPSGDRRSKIDLPAGSTGNAFNDAGRVVGVAPISLSFSGAFQDAPVTVVIDGALPAADLPFSPALNYVPRGSASDVNICGMVVGSLKRWNTGMQRAIRWEKINECDDDPAPVLRVAR